MTLRASLDDFKRHRDHPRRFPGERRTTMGLFSGLDDRLVYVDRAGWHRDYSYALSGRGGVERSRFGLDLLDGVRWLEDARTVSQEYVGETALVETVQEAGDLTVTQSDLSVGPIHCTRFSVEGPLSGEPTLRAFLDLAPGSQESRLGRLEHDRAVEVHHDTERAFVAASPGEWTVRGQLPERFSELLAGETVSFPRSGVGGRKYEDALLNGSLLLTVPLDTSGDGPATATLVSLLADAEDTSREAALDRIATETDAYDTRAALETAAREQVPVDVPAGTPRRELAVADLRVLWLLRAPTGAHIAGPDLDPFYAHTGGYGYTWFRDDAEIARYLLAADDRLGLGLGSALADSAAFYLDTQLPDGGWPHRVWAHSGGLAPGWAHTRVEGGEGVDFQADQTASVASFLASYLRLGNPDDPGEIEAAIERALDALAATQAGDGLPVECQNAWENMTGRFVHTAATFLHGYAAIARAPISEDLRERAREGADAVYDGLDALWASDRFALRETSSGRLDARLDSGSLALAEAHREYDAIGTLGERRRDRLLTHFRTLLSGLYRETDAIAGLIRFEGDDWRTRLQDEPKVWTVSTAWGANACTQLSALLTDREADREWALDRARSLLAEIDAGGSLVSETGYLPEQYFDDGTPDCATPLGWPHAIRLATVAGLDAMGELDSGGRRP